MACACCLPACSCKAIADNLDLTSIDYSFTSDWATGFSISGTLDIAGSESMKTSCYAEVEKKQTGGPYQQEDDYCSNTTYPKKDNSLTRLIVRFSYSCSSGPLLTFSAYEYVGVSQFGTFIPGAYFVFCGCGAPVLIDGDWYAGTRWDATCNASVFSSNGSWAIGSGRSVASERGTKNFDVFRAIDGSPWSSIRYPNKLLTAQQQFTVSLVDPKRKVGVNSYQAFNYTTSATLNFNALP